MVEPELKNNIDIMNKIKSLILFISTTAVLFSCSSEDPITSEVTYYPELTLLGDKVTLVEQGSAFDDPGIEAKIQGEDVEYNTQGSVDTSVPGAYSLIYSAENADGFAASVERTVYVYEDNGTIAGFWNGSSSNGSGFPVMITTTDDPNIFNITDILVGHYEYGVNYGPQYAAPSTLTVSGGSISSPGGTNGFGFWTVDGPSLSEDQKTMTWGATLQGQGFSLSGLKLEKVTP